MPTPFPHRFAWLIDNPARALLLSPKKLVDRLAIRSTDRILEIGPGSGYFSVALAREVPDGQLELLDVQPEMLEKSRTKLSQAGLTNVRFTVGDAGGSLPFAAGSFDIAILITVLGEIPNAAGAIANMARLLRVGGVLAIHEQLPDPDLISRSRLKRLVQPHGFELESVKGPGWNYTAIFRRA